MPPDQLSLYPPAGLTRGRTCRWYDSAGNVVGLTLDAWDADHDLQVVEVASVGPFDELLRLEEEMRQKLCAQHPLF